MRRKGVPDEAAVEVLRRLTDAGLVDDEAFAEAWVSSRHGGKGLARRALAGELRRRGVDDAVVEGALSQVDDDDEVVAATALVRRKLASTAGLPTPARVRRLSSMLARKGYSGGSGCSGGARRPRRRGGRAAGGGRPAFAVTGGTGCDVP